MLYEVVTTEKVTISFRVAGLGSRFLAWLVDACVILLFLVALAWPASVLEKGWEGLGSAVFLLGLFVLLWGYFLFFEWLWFGQTPGKRLVGIRVIQKDGTGLKFFEAALRNLLRFVDGLPFFYAVGFVVAACNPRFRRLGDLVAGTMVVHLERRARAVQPLLERPAALERAQEMLVRQRLAQLDRVQKQTILDLCLRRDQLRLRPRVQTFHAVADYLQTRLKLVREEFQSDEKLVLQVAALLGERTPEKHKEPTKRERRTRTGSEPEA